MEKINFIWKAKQNCYAANSPGLILPDKSKTLVFENNCFRYVDTYYGYNPFGGQEVVFRKEDGELVPIWYMNYGGSCLEVENRYTVEGILRVLKAALLKVDEYFPFRGPKVFECESFVYKSKASGGFDFFSGTEEISFDGELVYVGHYFGGMLRLKEMLDTGI